MLFTLEGCTVTTTPVVLATLGPLLKLSNDTLLGLSDVSDPFSSDRPSVRAWDTTDGIRGR
jgi:hypothetical protein